MKTSRILFTTLLLGGAALMQAATPDGGSQTDSVYVFTYATSPQEGIHMAYSFDRRSWTPIGQNRSFVKSDFGAWGSGKKMYAPSVINDRGTWYAVWAVSDRDPQFATTRSADFWNWKPQDYPYMNRNENVTATVLSRRDGRFAVAYKTAQGLCYETLSEDFAHWSAPKPITQDEYAKRAGHTATIRIKGQERSGEIHRVPLALVRDLENRSARNDERNRTHGENTGQDAQRFAGVKELHAKLRIRPQDTKEISDQLVGIFFEDINYAADGGLYAELVQNRDFEYNDTDHGGWNARTAWTLEGNGSSFDIATDNPIHANNPHYAVVSTATPGAALVNGGFDGIPLKKNEGYDLSLFIKTLDGKAKALRISLKEDGKTLASTRIAARSSQWTQLKASLKPAADAKAARLCIEPLEEGKLAIDFVSLFPQKTFKGRKNGMRADLAQMLADLHPRFVRFPGGCVSHGQGLDNMYRWRETVGPLWERKPQSNIWSYHQSKGLGFYEYFQFCEDIGAEPLPVLPAAVCCQNSWRGGAGQQGGLPMDSMEAYAQELCDLIEWANGDPKTSPLARLRAEAGHPKPFGLKMLGVGNEDLISDVFTERFNYIFDYIGRKHPEIKIVGTVGPFFEGADYEYGWKLAREKQIPIVDEHYYVSPGWYVNNQQYYDSYDRKGTKVYLGEWASQGNRLENALAEAIHLTNLERNADVVVMSSYAPLLAKQGHTQWNPDLIYFNNNEVMPTVNYQVQKLFGNNAGNRYVYSDLDVTATKEDQGKTADFYHDGANARICRSVVTDSKTGDMIIKLVNMTPLETKMNVDLGTQAKHRTTAALTVLSGKPAEKDQKPQTGTLEIGKGNAFDYTLPPYSVSVIRIAR